MRTDASRRYFCPACHQRVLLRLGVLLSPKRADVFDAIQRHNKRGGISTDELTAMFGKISCVRVHISAINKLLAAKGWKIVCSREGSARGFYRLRKIKHEHRNQKSDVKTQLRITEQSCRLAQ